MAKNNQTPAAGQSSRIERILSFMAIGLVSTAVLTMLVTLIVTFIHRNSGDTSAIIIGVVVSSIIRRSRANR
jgi:putative flippase GtrA